MSDVIDAPADIEPAPIEIEPCELCGCAIEDLEELIYLRAADLIAQWERNDPRDNWKHTGQHPPRRQPTPTQPARPYRTPQATIDAFLYVVSLCNPERLKAWLGDHPQDAPFLLKLLEGK